VIWWLLIIAVSVVLGLRSAATIANKLAAVLYHCKYVWRFLSGHTLDGQHRTNATWTRRADTVLHPTGRAHAWHWLPRGTRALTRTGSVVMLLVTCYGLLVATTLTIAAWAVAVCAVTGYGIKRRMPRIRTWRHWWRYERPAQRAVARVTATSIAPKVTVALDGSTVQAAALTWPAAAEISAPDKKPVVEALETRLGLEAPDQKWDLTSRNRSALLTRSEPPPTDVTWEHVAADVAKAGPFDVINGVGKQALVSKASLKDDSPHGLISAGSGAGKSVLVAFLVIQALRRGAIALIIDPKGTSHPWAIKELDSPDYAPLPNVAYASSDQDVYNACVWCGVEARRRQGEAQRIIDGRGRFHGDFGPEIWIIAEEMNEGAERVEAYYHDEVWQQGMPKKCPAFSGLGSVSYTGRALKMRLWIVSQLGYASIMGPRGGAVRASMGLRYLASWETNWKLLAGKIPEPPDSDGVPGRFQFVTGGKTQAIQVPNIEHRARELILADGAKVTRVPADIPGAPWRPAVSDCPVPGGRRDITAGQNAVVLGHLDPDNDLITLTEALRDGVVTDVGEENLRKMAQRGSRGIPKAITPGSQGVPGKWKRGDLRQWNESSTR